MTRCLLKNYECRKRLCANFRQQKIQKLGEKSPLEVKIEAPENIAKSDPRHVPCAAVALGVSTHYYRLHQFP